MHAEHSVMCRQCFFCNRQQSNGMRDFIFCASKSRRDFAAFASEGLEDFILTSELALQDFILSVYRGR